MREEIKTRYGCFFEGIPTCHLWNDLDNIFKIFRGSLNSYLPKLNNTNTISSIMNWAENSNFHSIIKMLHKAFPIISMLNSILAYNY